MGLFNSKQTFIQPKSQTPKRDPLVEQYLKNIEIFTNIACKNNSSDYIYNYPVNEQKNNFIQLQPELSFKFPPSNDFMSYTSSMSGMSGMSGMIKADFINAVNDMNSMLSNDFMSTVPSRDMPSTDFISGVNNLMPSANFIPSRDNDLVYIPNESYRTPNYNFCNSCNENYENARDPLNYDTISTTWTKQKKYNI